MQAASDRSSLAVRLHAAASQAWRYFDWPNIDLLQPAGQLRRVQYEESRPLPGAVRRLEFISGEAIRERLEIYEPEIFHLAYRVIDTGTAPLAEYLGDLRITAAGDHACSVRMACEFTPLGASAAEFIFFWQQLNRATLEFVRSRVESQRSGESS